MSCREINQGCLEVPRRGRAGLRCQGWYWWTSLDSDRRLLHLCRLQRRPWIALQSKPRRVVHCFPPRKRCSVLPAIRYRHQVTGARDERVDRQLAADLRPCRLLMVCTASPTTSIGVNPSSRATRVPIEILRARTISSCQTFDGWISPLRVQSQTSFMATGSVSSSINRPASWIGRRGDLVQSGRGVFVGVCGVNVHHLPSGVTSSFRAEGVSLRPYSYEG